MGGHVIRTAHIVGRVLALALRGVWTTAREALRIGQAVPDVAAEDG